MQKYLSPAKRYMSRVLRNPADIKAFMHNRRLMVFGISTVLLLVVLLGFVAVRGRNMNSTNNDAYTHEEHAKGSSVTTIITNENPATISNGSGSASSSSDTKTSVTVNDQQIPVPQNGSVSKTITNGNGSTTQVDISHSSNSSNDSGSTSSTSVSAHTSSSSQSINYRSP